MAKSAQNLASRLRRLAWRTSVRSRNGLTWICTMHDGMHANPQGTYLTLAVLYATIFEQNPVGATYRMPADRTNRYGWMIPDDWQLSDSDAEFLQRIAWETVEAYE